MVLCCLSSLRIPAAQTLLVHSIRWRYAGLARCGASSQLGRMPSSVYSHAALQAITANANSRQFSSSQRVKILRKRGRPRQAHDR